MFDFRLHVFYTVAKKLNFTKAAEELLISQPAVTKHIKEIERHYQIKLFERNGNKILLTPAGNILLQYAEKVFELYREAEYEINGLQHKLKGTLRIGASTTIAQYILPSILALFYQKYKDIKITLITDNTQGIEHLMEQKEIDLGIIEGKSKNKSFSYLPFIKDEIVAVVSSKNSLTKKPFLKLAELPKIPLLLREYGSGTLEIIAAALKNNGIKISDLNVEMHMNSSESIKRYLLSSDCMSFLSVYSVLYELENKLLSIVDIKALSIDRYFYFIQPQGEVNELCKLFMAFANSHNLK